MSGTRGHCDMCGVKAFLVKTRENKYVCLHCFKHSHPDFLHHFNPVGKRHEK